MICNVSKWKETLAILIIYTRDRDFNELCNILGCRLILASDINNEFGYGII